MRQSIFIENLHPRIQRFLDRDGPQQGEFSVVPDVLAQVARVEHPAEQDCVSSVPGRDDAGHEVRLEHGRDDRRDQIGGGVK